jgi:hypothetical protein
MELSIYIKGYNDADAILNFMDFYYAIKMKYLASDLLDKGLTPKQISEAIVMAIRVANSSGIESQKHFMPVYSGMEETIIQDCKLSQLGFGLVLMNADANLSVVSEFQVDVLKRYLDNTF